jgi:hypothetical protein
MERVSKHCGFKGANEVRLPDKAEDYYLIRAFRAFGVESQLLYRYILDCVSNTKRLSRWHMTVGS